jgi:hypothetical protein
MLAHLITIPHGGMEMRYEEEEEEKVAIMADWTSEL